MGKLIGILVLAAVAYWLFARGRGKTRINRIEQAARRATRAAMRGRALPVETVACPVCGDYVPESAGGCTRPDCPLTGTDSGSKP